MVLLDIKGFALDKNKMPVIILREAFGDRILPLWIGPSEASAIIAELEGIITPCPQTHDAFCEIMLRHGFRIDRLEIYDRTEKHTYRSKIKYHRGLRRYSMEMRPSDGLALAVRQAAPILAEEGLFSAHSSLSDIFDESNQAHQDLMFFPTGKERNPLLM